MTLLEYINKFGIRIEEFALRTGLSYSTIYSYLNHSRAPRQKAAEVIEKETGDRVTVTELRGKDDRKKTKK